jgi:hypothetical protein
MFGSKTRTVAVVLAAAAISTLALASGAMAAAASDKGAGPKAVYALTNAPGGNAVVVYSRSGDGSLPPASSYPTGGNGSGAGLGSQDAVIVSDDGRLLFAVNAGSNSVSSFRIRGDGLERTPIRVEATFQQLLHPDLAPETSRRPFRLCRRRPLPLSDSDDPLEVVMLRRQPQRTSRGMRRPNIAQNRLTVCAQPLAIP